MLDIRDLRFSYGDRPVLQGVSLRLGVGELVFLLGANGAGKSTLFRCVLGLLPGYEGTVALRSGDTHRLSARALAREIAYIPQNHHPTFSYPVLDMVLMGTHHRLSPFSNPGPKEEAIALEALEQVGIRGLAQRDFQHWTSATASGCWTRRRSWPGGATPSSSPATTLSWPSSTPTGWWPSTRAGYWPTGGRRPSSPSPSSTPSTRSPSA